MLGEKFGGYRIDRWLAAGGTGRVYAASNDVATVALKLPVDDDPRTSEILVRESVLLSELAHLTSTIVAWKAHDLVAPTPWVAMELLENSSLGAFLDRTRPSCPITPEVAPTSFLQIVDIASKVADALSLMHERGIVHGDLTPNNVLVRPDGTPVIIDFGSAFRDPSLLHPRDVMREPFPAYGTRGYSAPEIELGNSGDGRRDLYSLGCLLWEMLTGRRPTRDLVSHVDTFARAGPLRDLLVGLLQPDPSARIASARDAQMLLASLRGVKPTFPAKPVLPRAGMVGRDAPMQTLRERLKEAVAGAGSATLLTGEAGIGKSRLLNEVIADAQRRRFQIFLVSCADADASRPRRDPAILAALQKAGSLTHLPPTGSSLSPEVERAQWLDLVKGGLTTAATQRPVLLVIDDLHWADEWTWALVRSERMSEIAQHGICVVASFRTKEQGTPDVESLPPIWKRIELTPLTADAVRSYAKIMLGSSVFPSGTDRWLHETSGGNPLYLTECVRELARLRAEQPTTDASESSNPSDLPVFARMKEWVPKTLGEVMTARVERLSREARSCVRIAAMLGDEFALDELGDLVGALWPNIDVSLVIREVTEAHIVEIVGAQRYRFSHNLFARSSLQPVPGVREDEIAAVLVDYYEERMGEVRTSLDWARLGHLHGRAGNSERAIAALFRAGELERAANQLVRARNLYADVIEQYELSSDAVRSAHRVVVGSAHQHLADILHRDGRYQEADRNYEQSLARAHSETAPLGRASLMRKRARGLRASNQYESAIGLIDAAHRELEFVARGASFWGEWIELEVVRFWAEYYARKPISASVTDLEPIVREHGSAWQQCDYYQCLCASLLVVNRYRGCQDSCHYAALALEALRRSSEQGDRLPNALMVAAFPLLWRDRPHWVEAIGLIEEADRGALWMDDLTLLAQTRTYLALALRRCGQLDRVETVAQSAYLAADRSNSRGYRGASLASLAWVAWKKGNLQEADRLAREARQWWRGGALRHPFQAFLNLVWADVLRSFERFVEAQDLLRELLAPDLQRLPQSLEDAILHAIAGDETSASDVRTVDKTLAQATRVALGVGYL